MIRRSIVRPVEPPRPNCRMQFAKSLLCGTAAVALFSAVALRYTSRFGDRAGQTASMLVPEPIRDHSYEMWLAGSKLVFQGGKLRIIASASLPEVAQGPGWSGATPDPDPVGSSSDPYYQEKAILLADVIPSQKYVGYVDVYVCGQHGSEGGQDGITAVKVDHDNTGTWVDMVYTVNPTTGKYAWGARLTSAATTGTSEPRFIGYPVSGRPRVLTGVCWNGSAHGVLYPRASTAVTQTLYCSQSGSDLGDGSLGNPFGPNLDPALDAIADGGEIVLLDPGVYTSDPGRTPRTNTYWTTVRGDSANARTDYQIEVPGGLATGFEPGFTKIKFQHVQLNLDTFASFAMGAGNMLWLNDIEWTFRDWFLEIIGQLFPFIQYSTPAHHYITESRAYDCLYGFLGADLCRNCAVEKCSAQAYTWTRLIVNCTMKDFNTNAGQDFTITNDGGSLLLNYSTDNIGTGKKGVLFITTGSLTGTNLSLATTYYLKRASATTCHVATSGANWDSNTFVAYGGAGTGTHSMRLSYHGDALHTWGGGEENYLAYYLTTLTGCDTQTMLRITADYWPGMRDMAFVDCDFSSMGLVGPGNFGGPPYSECVGAPNGAVGGTSGDISGTTLTLNETKDFSAYTGTCLVFIDTPTVAPHTDRSWFTVASFNPSAAACTSITLAETASASRTGRIWKVGGQTTNPVQATWPGGVLRHIIWRRVNMPNQRLSIYNLAVGGGINIALLLDQVTLHWFQYDAYVGDPVVWPEGTEFRDCIRGAAA